MMPCAIQQSGTSTDKPPAAWSAPPTPTTRRFSASARMQVVHCAPATVTESAATASTAATTVSARAVCRSRVSASTDSCTLHCTWPVLCATHDIHSPSHSVCATTMLESMNAVTFHIGSAHATITSSEPARPSASPSGSRHAASMVLLLLLPPPLTEGSALRLHLKGRNGNLLGANQQLDVCLSQ
ncbi:hypothetical protein EYF80_059634 [Liparis tanakae]|uniref:Uncharacterized protein n=1 Tax=Liparis tanakae TaxID=230148 RepID=A0A4Z2EMV2_9TELE|nr:hypothetical protein EYF80_059634 [Liparis tanakae]